MVNENYSDGNAEDYSNGVGDVEMGDETGVAYHQKVCFVFLPVKFYLFGRFSELRARRFRSYFGNCNNLFIFLL
jgi:hypothetical protein